MVPFLSYVIIVLVVYIIGSSIKKWTNLRIIYRVLKNYSKYTGRDLTKFPSVVIIPYNFSTGKELSAEEIGEQLSYSPENLRFITHDTRFFNRSYLDTYDDVLVIMEGGGFVSLLDVVSPTEYVHHMDEKVTDEDNLEMMLRSWAFSFRY